MLLVLGALQIYHKLFTSNSIANEVWLRILALTIYAAVTAVMLFLIWLISRRRSTLAKWTYIVLNLARVTESIIVPLAISQILPSFPPIAWAQLAVLAISIWLLFRSDARRWFRNEWAPVDPEIFR